MAEKRKLFAIDALQDGQMKAVELGEEQKVLIVRRGDTLTAIGHSCPHYGAELEDGCLCEGTLCCPWHHARFDAADGRLLDPPSLDGLPTYEVSVEEGSVVLTMPDTFPKRRTPSMISTGACKTSPTFAIVGAGAAGMMAAQTLREEGFDGRLLMITKEQELPYDRTNLSKGYLSGEVERKWLPLRKEFFFAKHGIELLTDHCVTNVDVHARRVECENAESIAYDKLLVATGGAPRKLDVQGRELTNIFTLRNLADADRIKEAAERARQVVIIGGSFVGMETAAALRERKLKVSVVARESVPFERIFGREVGKLFLRTHEEQGVTFYLGRNVSRFEGDDQVRAVVLDDGKSVEADLVILGVGVVPETSALEGLERAPDGGIKVDRYLAAAEHVYAAGDIAHVPSWRTGDAMRIEHWRMAQQQGRIAALNMAGKQTPFQSVPFFWTRQAGLNLRYVGHASRWDETLLMGDIASQTFLLWYLQEGKVLAVAGMGRDREMAAVEELMLRERLPSHEELRSGHCDLLGRCG